MLSDEQLVTSEQIAQFQRDGAILIRGALNGEEIAMLNKGVEEASADPGSGYMHLTSPEGKGRTRLGMFPSFRCPSLDALLATGTIPEIAGRLMGCLSAQLIFDQTLAKQAGLVNPTPWHQDTTYLRVHGFEMARVWLSADPSPRDITVRTVRGSHRWNVTYATKFYESEAVLASAEADQLSGTGRSTPALPFVPDIARYPESFDIMSWDVEPGDALVFYANVLHGAGGKALHATPRRAFASMWGGPDIRYHRTGDGDATPTSAEAKGIDLPNDVRIGDHEDVFTVGWRA